MEIIDKNKLILTAAFKEMEALGCVVVGGQSFLEATSGILCIHPINTGHLINEIAVRLSASEDSE
jgi:hypothetical protein